VPQSKQLTINQALSRAKKATKQGNIEAALQLYNTILQHQPDHPVAIKRLRKLEKSLSYSQRVQTQTTNPSEQQLNTLVDLYHAGQMAKTEWACRELLETFPKSLIVINVLGVALQEQGKSQEAVKVFDGAIRIEPGFADAYSNRGNALRDLGLLKEAIASCEMAIKIEPAHALAYNNRGNAFRDLGLPEKAVESCDKAIEIEPDFSLAYSNRGNALRDLGLLKEAIESYERAIELEPGFAEAYSNRGDALRELGLLEESVESCKKAIEIKPDYAEAYNNCGNALKGLGQLKESVESYERAIEIKPDYAEAYRNLSGLKKYTTGDAQIRLMENLLTYLKPGDSERTHLCFALAKVYEDLGEYDRSFNCLAEGNRLRKKELGYNISNDIGITAKIKQVFSVENPTLDAIAEGNTSIQPVFIVGMPRSGTSLVEQILASHSKVHGAGELEAIHELVSPILEKLPDHAISQSESKILQSDICELHRGYLEVLAALNVPEKVITDKMPLNFQYIGFILSAFPKAKIIHTNRDSRAICWSNYKHYFSSNGNGYAYDLMDLVEFYNLYLDLMSFWREQYPNSIYDLYYEDLTENQEQETRRLLEFCDLEWEERCLDFHRTERAVKTASSVQVRKKMYKGSSEAWRQYEEHLQPMINGLCKPQSLNRVQLK